MKLRISSETADLVNLPRKSLMENFIFLCRNNCYRLGLLFPYGFFNGDNTLPYADDSDYVVFTSGNGFPFFTNKEYQLRVCIHRFVAFVLTSTDFRKRKMVSHFIDFHFYIQVFGYSTMLNCSKGDYMRGEGTEVFPQIFN